MPSGVLQLLITGAQDKILISNPQMSYFKQVYMKYSSFSIFNYEIPITSQYDFGSTVSVEIPKNGDLLRGIQIKVELPQINIQYNNPLSTEINNIKKKYSYKSIDLNTYDYNLFNLNTFADILRYQQGNSSNITNFELYWYDSNTQVETYNVIIPKIDLNSFIEPSKTTEYYFEINPDTLIFNNANIIYNFPLIDVPVIQSNYDQFYSNTILYSNRNNKLSSTLNIVNTLIKKNDQTTLLTSDNIKNILIKNIKDNLFKSQEISGIDSLKRYIDSIRFIRPITLYNDTSVKNILHGGDNDLIGYPEYNQTYYKTIVLDQIVIQASISNQLLSTLDTRLMYVFTADKTDNQIYCQGNVYNLYNILKIDFINTTILNSSYNSIEITSYNLLNYTDLFKNNILLIQFKITPFSSSYDFQLNNFSELFPLNSIELLLNGDYKIVTNKFFTTINLVGTYLYFYYNITPTQTNILPFCILKINRYYFVEDNIYIFAVPINSTGLTFTKNLSYFVNNQYILQINEANNNDFDLKKISIANIDLDSMNIYNNYISQSSNINFNLNGTIDVENSQKQLFQNNFNIYILQNIYDNYAILNNIISTAFKNPTDFSSIQNPVNLFYQVDLTNNSTNGLLLNGLGSSTFTNTNSNGVSIMISFLQSILNINFDGSTIINNYFLQNINNAINKYGGDYQNNWNNINNIIQNSAYMINMNRVINLLQNTNQYILLQIDANISIGANIGQVNVINSTGFITSLYLSDSDIILNNSNIYHVYLYLNNYNSSNVEALFNIYPDYQLSYNNTISNITNITYADTNYFNDLNIFLQKTNLYNQEGNLVSNYILEDYLFNLLEYYKKTYQIYLQFKKYYLSDGSDILPIISKNILYKYVIINTHQLFIDINNRINKLITLIQQPEGINFLILSDFLYLTNAIKINSYLYDRTISTFYNKYMYNKYFYVNSFSNYSLLTILGDGIILNTPTYEYFSSFINYTLNADPFFNTNYGDIFKTYIYYIYGSQLLTTYGIQTFQVGSIQDDSFNYSNIINMTNLLNTYGPINGIYDYNGITSYFNTINSTIFNNKGYQFKMNPHLYYSYLNLGYIENIISLVTTGNIDLNINSYSNFSYSNIDSLTTTVMGYYTGLSNINGFGNIILLEGNNFYSNVITNSTIKNNILTTENNEINLILNDLVNYSSYRIPTNGVNSTLLYTCNAFITDINQLLIYFNDNIDNIQFIRYILLNDTTLSSSQLSSQLNIPNYTSLDKQQINDYSLQYFISNGVYTSISNYRTTYTYNDLLTGFDIDVSNYYNYLTTINNSANIGSSLKSFSDEVSYQYSNADIYELINHTRVYGQIIISNISDVNTYILNSKNVFQNYYNEYNNNKQVLDIRDDIELNTFNNTIKNINLTSGQYNGSLSSMDQFKVYDRKLFGYIVDPTADYIFDSTSSVTHVFNTQSNIADISYYNIPILDTNIYDQHHKTYYYQLKKLQSYFFNDVYGLNDTDLNYIKPYYALENTDNYYYNQLYISQINKLYNYDIPSYISANIISSLKLDHNFNLLDYDTNRIMNNGIYYLDTLKMLDNIESFSMSNVKTMVNFLENNIIYTNYVLNCEKNSLKYKYKQPYSLVDWGTIIFFSNGLQTLNIPILNRYIYTSYNLQILDNTNSLKLYYYNFLYLLHDLFLLDGNMRIKYSDISSTSSTYFNVGNFANIYRTLIIEYFYLIFKGKQFIQENELSTIKFSDITNLITTSQYDKISEYLLYCVFDDSVLVGNGSYDLFNVLPDYKIPQIISNHRYSENFTIIYSIKDSFNDKNFGHLINLTNYNNKYSQFYDNNYQISSNIKLLQNLYMANVGITNTYTFIGNLIVTNEDYSLIQQSISNQNYFNPNSIFYIDSNIGNLRIDMNDIKYIKENIIEYYLNQITNSQSIVSTSQLDTSGNIVNIMGIDDLVYKGNTITDINVNLSKNTFSIRCYDANIANFNIFNIPSLNLWLDSTDKSNIFTDANATINVKNDGDSVSIWQNRSYTGLVAITEKSVITAENLYILANNNITYTQSQVINANANLQITIDEMNQVNGNLEISIGKLDQANINLIISQNDYANALATGDPNLIYPALDNYNYYISVVLELTNLVNINQMDYSNAVANTNISNIYYYNCIGYASDAANALLTANLNVLVAQNNLANVYRDAGNLLPTLQQPTVTGVLANVAPSWNINGGISFNGQAYFSANYQLNTTSTVFLVTDTAISGGYYLYFDGGNVYSSTSMQGPTYWTDGPYCDYIYDDFNFNTEDILLSQGAFGKNIFSTERIDGNYDSGYTNANFEFTYNNNNQYTTGNVGMTVFPGYLDSTGNIAEAVTGNICEILVFNEVLSDYTKYQINSYLGYKWGIKSKIFTDGYSNIVTFPFDYLPKLYSYNVNTNGNLEIQLNHLYDSTFANIYNNVYLEYKNVLSDIYYEIKSNINMTDISKYLYFTDFMSDIQTLLINYKFNYDLAIDPVDFNIMNGNIYIDPKVVLNYNQYINAINDYLPNISIKDTYNFFLTPLQFDTGYITYTLMNHGANVNTNANLYLQKIPALIDEGSFIILNTNDRMYNQNQLLNIFYNISINGELNYEKLNLGNTYIGNIKLPTIPYNTSYKVSKYSNFNSQIGGDSNVLVLNTVLDINNKEDNLPNELQRLLDNTNTKIIQTEYDITNYNNVNQMIAQISLRPETAVVSWIEKLGIYFADYFEFYIGGQLIERIEDDYMNCIAELYLTPDILRSFVKMIGQDVKLVLKKSTLGKYLLYIDIPFYFNKYKKNSGLSVPLIALLYNKLNLKFNIKKLEDLLVNLPYTNIKRLSKLRMTLMADYILLDSDERKKFAESKHEYIIEQVQYSNYAGSQISIKNQIKYNFKNPTKMLIWFAQLKDKQNKKQYYNYTADDYYIDIHKYSDPDETNNVYFNYLKQKNKYMINAYMSRNTGNVITDFKELDVLRMPFENYTKGLQNQLIYSVKPHSDPLIASSELKVNGHSRFVTDRYETGLVKPYAYFNNSYLNGINVYNFCLHPFDPQPSGSINFTFLNDISMYLDFNSNNIPDQEFRVKSMTVSYNLLRVMSGYGGLAFDHV
jgi:hypothetical protein